MVWLFFKFYEVRKEIMKVQKVNPLWPTYWGLVGPSGYIFVKTAQNKNHGSMLQMKRFCALGDRVTMPWRFNQFH